MPARCRVLHRKFWKRASDPVTFRRQTWRRVSSDPPRIRSDGGYGAVAALVGSYMSDLGCLVPGCLDYHELIFAELDSYIYVYVALPVVGIFDACS